MHIFVRKKIATSSPHLHSLFTTHHDASIIQQCISVDKRKRSHYTTFDAVIYLAKMSYTQCTQLLNIKTLATFIVQICTRSWCRPCKP